MGREFESSVLELCGGARSWTRRRALAEATAARLVTTSADITGHYRFSHALIRETLYEGLPALRRAAIHLQIGRALEAIYGEASDAHLAALAHHFLQAASLGQVDKKAVTYAVQAGSRADRLLAYEEAVSQYRSALRALNLMQEPTIREEESCCSPWETRRRKPVCPMRPAKTFGQAAAWARRHGSLEQLARAALGIGAGTAARTRLEVLSTISRLACYVKCWRAERGRQSYPCAAARAVVVGALSLAHRTDRAQRQAVAHAQLDGE